MVHIGGENHLYLIAIPTVPILLRVALISGSRPLLGWLNTGKDPVTVAEASVITWGGLRGAVGLALAIQVYRDRAPKVDGGMAISQEEGEHDLSFVAGVAFLTTVVKSMRPPCKCS